MLTLEFRHVVFRDEASKRVTCERCGRTYGYTLTRSAALDTVPLPLLIRQSEKICRERVARRLAADVEPVACPACGWMQADMVREQRRRFARPIATCGAYLAVVGGAMTIACVLAGVYNDFQPGHMHMDWFGITAAAAGIFLFGMGLIGLRGSLGLLRYGILGAKAGTSPRADCTTVA